MLRSLCDRLADFAGREAVVIGVDDVQYADPLSMEFLRYLARRSRPTRTLLVVTCDDVPVPLLRLPHRRQIMTAPLTERQTRRLWELATGGTVPRRTAFDCHRLSGGSPLLLTALVRDNAPEAAAARAASRHPASDGDLVVGEDYVRSCLCLLHRYPSLAAVVRALAVLGADATTELAARMLRSCPDVIAPDIARLGSTGVLDGARFRHPAVGAAVLAALPERESRELHARAAEVLALVDADVVTVARHQLRAHEHPGPAAVATLCAGARELLARGEPARAAVMLRAADRGELDDRQRARIAVGLVDALMRFSPSAAQGELWRLLPALRAGLLPREHQLRLIVMLLWFGLVEEAGEAVDLLVAATNPEAQDDLDLVRHILTWMGPSLVDRLPRPNPASPARSGVSAAACIEHTLRIPLPGAELPCRLTELIQAAEHPENLLRALVPHTVRTDGGDWGDVLTAVSYLSAQGGLAAIEQLLKVLLAEAARTGSLTYHAVLLCLRAELALKRGDMPTAATHAGAALETLPLGEWGAIASWPLSVLTAVAAAGSDGVPTEVLRHPVSEESFATGGGMLHLLARGRYCLATGRLYAALRDLTMCGRLMAEWPGAQDHPLPWRSTAGEVYLRLGRPDRACALAEEELAHHGAQNERIRGAALRVLAAASAPPERLSLLQRAVRALRESGDRYELARAMADLGRAHETAGNARQAEAAWRQFHNLAAKCGVHPLPTDPGPGPRASTTTEPQDLLSDAERRVAALAASGRSNRQIAEQLYITVSTVEQHLTRVYRKLGVCGRVDLSRTLRAGAPDDYPQGGCRRDAKEAPRSVNRGERHACRTGQRQ
ncbi:LuxR C-terminal-related transcriptional regulator [Streptomyces sp. NPDC002845]